LVPSAILTQTVQKLAQNMPQKRKIKWKKQTSNKVKTGSSGGRLSISSADIRSNDSNSVPTSVSSAWLTPIVPTSDSVINNATIESMIKIDASILITRTDNALVQSVSNITGTTSSTTVENDIIQEERSIGLSKSYDITFSVAIHSYDNKQKPMTRLSDLELQVNSLQEVKEMVWLNYKRYLKGHPKAN
jgi:hypothetical protein